MGTSGFHLPTKKRIGGKHVCSRENIQAWILFDWSKKWSSFSKLWSSTNPEFGKLKISKRKPFSVCYECLLFSSITSKCDSITDLKKAKVATSRTLSGSQGGEAVL